MPRPYSTDLRERAVEAVESGGSRREIAEMFKVGVSSVIRWCQRWSETGSAAPKRSGGSVSPLEEHSDWILALIAKQPDLTLEEILAVMAKQGIPGSRSALQRFFVAPFVIDGAMNGPIFLAYIEQCLARTLGRRDIVIMDNLPAHKVAGVIEAIEALGASVLYLPSYSPDLNPIEQFFSKLKALLRQAAERTIPNLWRRIRLLLRTVCPEQCANFLRHAGYVST